MLLCVLDEGAPWDGDLNPRQLSGYDILEAALSN